MDGSIARIWSSYRRNIRLHVLPHVGGRQLQTLGPLDLDRMYAALSRTGNRKTGGALAARSVLYVHSIVHHALADATRKGLVPRNVADAASPPSAKAAKAPEMAWWTPEELSRFLDLVGGEEQFPLYRLAAMTGMRRGECCGLRWADIDMQTGRVNVRRQYVVADHEAHFAPRTKSDHGRRTIDLDAKTIAILRAHRGQQVAGRLAAGGGYPRIATSCSVIPTASHSTRRRCRRHSSAGSGARAFRTSDFTTSGIRMPRT